jgi:hypothetical protein
MGVTKNTGVKISINNNKNGIKIIMRENEVN